MSPNDRRVGLYVVQLAVLTTHQADAAFWREWEVFGIPGGLPFFLAFTAVAVGVLAFGLVVVARDSRRSRTFQVICASLGLITLVLHSIFLVRDEEAFWTVSSFTLFAILAICSPLQLAWARRDPDR